MKKNMKLFLTTLIVSSALVLGSCASSADTDTSEVTEDTTSDSAIDSSEVSQEDANSVLDQVLPVIEDESMLPQFSEMQDGEAIAILETNFGDITMRFFPQYAPKAVENFLTLSQEGYYDDVTFHRVINDFMIQGGDPTGTGTGGESMYGAPFEDEISPYLKHFPGAVAMANAGSDTNGSQFYIVENDSLDDETKEFLDYFEQNPKESSSGDQESSSVAITNDRYISPTVAEKYIELGGTPTLDYYYTVFGQVIDGMDVVHAIADTETYDGSDGTQADKPKEDVVINHVDVTTYDAKTGAPSGDTLNIPEYLNLDLTENPTSDEALEDTSEVTEGDVDATTEVTEADGDTEEITVDTIEDNASN